MELSHILEWFNLLPPIGKLMLGLGFLMPFTVLHTFLNPEPSKPDKKKKYAISDVKLGKVEFKVSIENK